MGYCMENKLPKYILSLLFVVIALLGGIDMADDAVLENPTPNLTYEVCHYSDASETESDLFIPRRTSGTNFIRLHGTEKRMSNAPRNSSWFMKDGKFVNLCIGFIQKESLNIKYSFTKPANRLIVLGKLII